MQSTLAEEATESDDDKSHRQKGASSDDSCDSDDDDDDSDDDSDDDDYSGEVVAGYGSGGVCIGGSTRMEAHLFTKGDALVFPSHKYHTIAPVTRGRRQVLVLEFWRGDARPCNHRCEVESGPCDGHGKPLSDDAASLLFHLEN